MRFKRFGRRLAQVKTSPAAFSILSMVIRCRSGRFSSTCVLASRSARPISRNKRQKVRDRGAVADGDPIAKCPTARRVLSSAGSRLIPTAAQATNCCTKVRGSEVSRPHLSKGENGKRKPGCAPLSWLGSGDIAADSQNALTSLLDERGYKGWGSSLASRSSTASARARARRSA